MLPVSVNKLAVAILITFTASVWQPGGGAFKCFMDYRAITDTSSLQYQLQAEAWTDENGLRRIDECYCIALGSAYGSHIGDKYLIRLSTGAEFMAILSDQKADADTVDGHTRDRNGAVVEFIVDAGRLPADVKRMGDISYVPGFTGTIEKIWRLKL